MRTKRYELTEYEVHALRNACIEYYQQTKNLKPGSPVAQKMYASLYGLKEQFITDCANWQQTD